MPLQILNTEIDQESLFQGDIIQISEEIRENLLSPFLYKKEDAEYLVLLTQSCDLVKRSEFNGNCKAQLLHVGLLSKFDVYLNDQLDTYCERGLFPDQIRIIDESGSNKLRNNLTRLFNNNINDVFFVPEDASLGLIGHYVVYLRDQWLISYEHYDSLLANKRFELLEIFRAKLGFMVSQLFSRIGTRDWNKEELDTIIRSLVQEHSLELKKEKIKNIKKHKQALLDDNPSKEDLIEAIKKI